MAWVAPANLTRQAGTVLIRDDAQTHFEGIIFDEIAPREWMAGSDFYRRANKGQSIWPGL